MAEAMTFKLIMVFVDDKKVELVLDAGRAAGATGGTIVPNARGQGMKPHLTFFGLEFLAGRTIVLFVVEARRATAVMDAVTAAGGLDETAATGIALELDISRVTGLSEHVRMLQNVMPVDSDRS